MDDQRLEFLFGEGVVADEDELADEDVRTELLEATFDEPLTEGELIPRHIIANQIYADEPPETWQAVERMLDAGLDRDAIFRQLVPVIMRPIRLAMDEDEPFDRAAYVQALDSLPLPDEAAIQMAVLDLVRAQPEITSEEVDAAIKEQFDRDAEDDGFEALLGQCVEPLLHDDDGALAYLPGDRLVHVDDVTAGITLTHRLTAEERDTATLDAGFDLGGFRRRLDLETPAGDPVDPVPGEQGTLEWQGPHGWFDDCEPGTILAVSVDDDGTIRHRALDIEPAVDPSLVERVRAAYDDEVAEPWLPVRGDELVIALQVQDRATFGAPRAPLDELCAAAGLERRGDEVAHEQSVWESERQTARFSRLQHGIDEHDVADAVLHVLAVGDLLAGVPADQIMVHGELDAAVDPGVLSTVLAELEDPRVLAHAAVELFSERDPDTGEVAGGRYVAALRDVASTGRDVATADYLAALHAERADDVLGAETLLRAAYQADPDNPAVIDRLAWYESDRGEAAKAIRLWRLLEPDDELEQDIAALEAYVPGAAGRGLGRNDPCWCGSGRKYKQCHLGVVEAPPLADRILWLYLKAVAYLERRADATGDDRAEIAYAMAGESVDREALFAAAADPLVADLALHELGWFEQFVQERGPLLPDDEHEVAEAWATTDRTVFEIEAVDDDDRVTLRDLRSGEQVVLPDLGVLDDAEPGDLVCGRAVPVGDTHQLVGRILWIDEAERDGLLALLDDGDAFALAEHLGRG